LMATNTRQDKRSYSALASKLLQTPILKLHDDRTFIVRPGYLGRSLLPATFENALMLP